ncbi:SMAD/FHA domain [Phytophthora cinnamomi]|uniref:SMAD/FHA domain n=1 Tax=Phytophthora cinnamomi TaxID=4785 RepID=UPI00355A632E|nr:SMAD/FHA domain [Phytophthora cinnamomi]
MASSPPPPPQPKLLPWGRLVLLSRGHRSSLPDHFDLSRSQHCVGRVANRCDLHIPKNFISGLHSIIRLKGKDSRGEPIVEIEDQSRYGTWVDRVKIGYRRKTALKKGGVVHFTAPDSKEVTEISYRLEILPSGLTQQNEELHAKMSADEMSVADRTRKRTHEETQCTQSPTKVVCSPPRPRPVKKPVPESGSQVPSSTAAGKRRRRPDVPAPDSKLAELKKKYGTIILDKEVELKDKSKKLEKAEEALETLRKENEALKQKHGEELAKIKAEAAAELKKVKADAAKQEEISSKERSELQHERDGLKRAIQHILADPKAPSQVRSIVELEAKIQQLKNELRSKQDDLAIQSHDGRPQTTPSPKKKLVMTERQQQLTSDLAKLQSKRTTIQKEYSQALSELTEKETEVTALIRAATDPSPGLSGSSQSQDSIDAGSIRNDRRDSQVSTELSEPSPGDQLQTHEEEAKSGGTPQGLPPLFNIYGTRSAIAGNARPATLSGSQFYRPRPSSTSASADDQESKTQQNEAIDETKEN